MNYVLVIVLSVLATVPLALPLPVTVEPDPVMACGMTAAEMAAMGKQDPEQEPPAPAPVPNAPPPSDDPEAPPGGHTEPTEFCTPLNRPDGKMPCMCTMDIEGRAGCTNGKRESEVRHCNSFCWKQWCKCCSS